MNMKWRLRKIIVSQTTNDDANNAMAKNETQQRK